MYEIFRIVGLVRYYLKYAGSGIDETTSTVLLTLSIIALITATYFIGGLNFSILLSKKLYGVDIRTYGSGNAGSTNMLRTFGNKAGIVTMVGDMSKTLVSCLLGYVVLGRLGAFVGGLFCMIGHMFPVLYKFKGGKGVACAAIVILTTDIGNPHYFYIPIVFLIMFAIFAIVLFGAKYMSLASVMSVLLYPLVMNAFDIPIKNAILAEETPTMLGSIFIVDSALYLLIALLMAVLVIFMHRANIKRLLNKEESKFSFHKKGEKSAFEIEKETEEQKEKRKELRAAGLTQKDKNTSKKK